MGTKKREPWAVIATVQTEDKPLAQYEVMACHEKHAVDQAKALCKRSYPKLAGKRPIFDVVAASTVDKEGRPSLLSARNASRLADVRISTPEVTRYWDRKPGPSTAVHTKSPAATAPKGAKVYTTSQPLPNLLPEDLMAKLAYDDEVLTYDSDNRVLTGGT